MRRSASAPRPPRSPAVRAGRPAAASANTGSPAFSTADPALAAARAEEPELGRDIGLAWLGVIVHVVARDVGQRRRGEAHPVEPVLREAVARGLHRRMGAALLGQPGQRRVQGQRIRAWCARAAPRSPAPSRRACRGRPPGAPPRAQIRRRNWATEVLPLVPVTAAITSGCAPCQAAAIRASSARGSASLRNTGHGEAGHRAADHLEPVAVATTATAPMRIAYWANSAPSSRVPGTATKTKPVAHLAAVDGDARSTGVAGSASPATGSPSGRARRACAPPRSFRQPHGDRSGAEDRARHRLGLRAAAARDRAAARSARSPRASPAPRCGSPAGCRSRDRSARRAGSASRISGASSGTRWQSSRWCACGHSPRRSGGLVRRAGLAADRVARHVGAPARAIGHHLAQHGHRIPAVRSEKHPLARARPPATRLGITRSPAIGHRGIGGEQMQRRDRQAVPEGDGQRREIGPAPRQERRAAASGSSMPTGSSMPSRPSSARNRSVPTAIASCATPIFEERRMMSVTVM